MRRFRIRKVVENVFSRDTTGRGRKQRTALNVVWLECGHVAEVTYWPLRGSYHVGDRCRCYACPKNWPTTTPDEWRKDYFNQLADAWETNDE